MMKKGIKITYLDLRNGRIKEKMFYPKPKKPMIKCIEFSEVKEPTKADMEKLRKCIKLKKGDCITEINK